MRLLDKKSILQIEITQLNLILRRTTDTITSYFDYQTCFCAIFNTTVKFLLLNFKVQYAFSAVCISLLPSHTSTYKSLFKYIYIITVLCSIFFQNLDNYSHVKIFLHIFYVRKTFQHSKKYLMEMSVKAFIKFPSFSQLFQILCCRLYHDLKVIYFQ